jgi:hypothetical protein
MVFVAPRWSTSLLLTIALCGCQLGVAPPANMAVSKVEESAKVAQEGCKPLKQSPNQISVIALAADTGRRCLVQDLVQRNMWDLIDGRNRGSPRRNGVVVVLEAKDLDLDLRGHLATGLPFEDTLGIYVQSDASQIRIHNGKVRTPGPRGIGAWMVPYKNVDLFKFEQEDEPPKYLDDDPHDVRKSAYFPWDYQKPPTHNTLENLHIESGGRGVVMAGDGNVLRHNTIEVESSTAIVVYGPNAVIEDNTFIVHPRRDDQSDTTAALKLRDAHGAVIRNNRIVIKTGLFADKAEAAINLIESRNVTIENNVVEGAKALVRKDAATTTQERGNRLQ